MSGFRLAAAVGLLSFVALAATSGLSAHAEGALARAEDGRTGISYGAEHRHGAIERAMRECGGGCGLVTTFAQTCAAIAVSERGGWGWATRDRLGWADDAAIEACLAHGSRYCHVQLHGCDRG